MRLRITAATLVLLAIAAGCSSEDEPKSHAKGPDRVTYATGFGAVGRDAFVWVARDKGFFAEAGIEVDIQKGAGNVPNLTMLKSGRAQFAAMDFAGAELLAGQGKFTEWRAVAAVHQQTLVSIMTTADTGITKPADLSGKTVATAKGSVSEVLFPAYAKLAGLDPAKVTIQGTQTTALNGLMAQRQVDAISTFLLSRKALETASKKQVVVMPYSDYLKSLYGNVIVTQAGLISSDRDLVQRFTTAALKGLRYTLDHPQEAAEILNKAEPTAAIPAAVGEIEAMKPYAEPLGRLDENRITAGLTELNISELTPASVADLSFCSGTPTAGCS